jgi:hypothetical protein
MTEKHEIPSDYSNFDPPWIAKRLRHGYFIAQPRPTTNTAFFDQPRVGCEADGASAAAHDAVDSRDE